MTPIYFFKQLAPIAGSDFGLEIEGAADPVLSMLRPDDKSAAENADAANNAEKNTEMHGKDKRPRIMSSQKTSKGDALYFRAGISLPDA